MVGSEHDEGYNQAVSEAAVAVGKKLGVNVLQAQNIPENANVSETMSAMVQEGAKVIFATSYNYFPYALKFAKAHPSVIVLHQGGYLNGKFPKNFGTYFGQTYDTMSLAGMAAAAASKTGQLGFIYAFPIPSSLANIDAFELGAQRINPKAVTHVIATSNWCDPVKQEQAVTTLASMKVDVIANHQDCQDTILQTAKTKGIKVVGMHHNNLSVDPTGWVTGGAWDWTPVYTQIIKAVEKSKFTGSQWNSNWFGSYSYHDNPFVLAPYGPSVSASVKSKISSWLGKLSKPNASTFIGPLYCANGKTMVPAGKSEDANWANTELNCTIKGVKG
jgi:simple sugar transport system substrate-binding protein/basic membrane protein A